MPRSGRAVDMIQGSNPAQALKKWRFLLNVFRIPTQILQIATFEKIA